jgi:hypothetical protein
MTVLRGEIPVGLNHGLDRRADAIYGILQVAPGLFEVIL